MKNSQSGQTGFLIILLMSALLIVAISASYAVTQNSKRTAEENAGTRILNLAESGTDLILSNALEGLKDFNLTENQINSSYTYQTDKSVVFPIPQGATLELNPSKNKECQNNSCVIGIWWNNIVSEENIANSIPCDRQAALLVSEYSQDAYDVNQTSCNNMLQGKTVDQFCGGDASCKEFYSSCQSAADNVGSKDVRTDKSRERARFYLFRPAACAGSQYNANGNGVAGTTQRQWDGYETAFGNVDIPGSCGGNDLRTKPTSGPACGVRTMTGVSDASCTAGGRKPIDPSKPELGYESCTGTVTPGQSKTRQDYIYNQDLSKQFANYYELPVFPNTTIVRIKALYADTEILIDLRDQVTQGISTVTDGSGTQRSIEVKKTVPSVPSVMDYALFSGGGDIDKKATPIRD